MLVQWPVHVSLFVSWVLAKDRDYISGRWATIPALSHTGKIPESPKTSPVYRDLDSVSTSYADLGLVSISLPGPRFRLHPLRLRLHLPTRTWLRLCFFLVPGLRLPRG